jgi:hypothetical protein
VGKQAVRKGKALLLRLLHQAVAECKVLERVC